MNAFDDILEDAAAELYNVISESAVDGILVVDEYGTILAANGAIKQIFGYERNELLGRPCTMMVPERLRVATYQEMARHIANEHRSWHVDWTGLAKDGREFPLEASSGYIQKKGRHFITSIVRDISEQRAAEQTRAHLAAIVRSCVDAIFTKDLEGIVTSWNLAAERLFGWKSGEIIGQRAALLIPPDRAQEECDSIACVRGGRKMITHIETERLHKNGGRIPVFVTTSAIRNSHEEVIGFSKIMHDISNRKRLETELARNTSRLQGIIASAMDAIISIDADQRIALYNCAAEKMFGWPAEKMLGQPIELLIPERFRTIHRQHVAHFSETGLTSRHMGALGKVSALRATGEEFPVEASISKAEIPREKAENDSNEKLLTVIIRDVSQRDQLENEIRSANLESGRRAKELEEAVTELKIFTYSLSHDMRAPLRAMRAFSDALLEEASQQLNAEHRDYLKRIGRSAARINDLIEDVLIYKEVTDVPVECRTVHLETLIRDIIIEQPQLMANADGIRVDRPLLPVMAHEGLLARCLTNLMVNAVKFVASDVKPEVRIWSELRGECVRVWIEDNGIGIEPAFHEKIFIFFERLHSNDAYEGTGIGLALAKKGITRMGGKIGLESEFGKGSRFWFELPGAPIETDSDKDAN